MAGAYLHQESQEVVTTPQQEVRLDGSQVCMQICSLDQHVPQLPRSLRREFACRCDSNACKLNAY